MAHESVARVRQQGGLLSPLQLEYIEWLCDPERRGSKVGWARDHGVAELNISPDRIQMVVDALHRAAAGGDTKAAQLYLQYVDRLQPKRVVIEDARVASLSDEELAAELQSLLGEAG